MLPSHSTGMSSALMSLREVGHSIHLTPLLSVDPEILIETALLRACHLEIGRILLLHIHAPHRQQIRCPGDRMIRGLWNLNFYVDDIRDTARLAECRWV